MFQSSMAHHDKVVVQKLKEPKDISGVHPVSDFIEPSHYDVPILHIEIGFENNAVDNFFYWVEDHIEVASPEEKRCRNKMISLDTELQKVQVKAQEQKQALVQHLANQWYSLSQVKKDGKSRTTLQNERVPLLLKEHQLGDQISSLVKQRKDLDSEAGIKRKKLADEKVEGGN
jgi:hypothetical protein